METSLQPHESLSPTATWLYYRLPLAWLIAGLMLLFGLLAYLSDTFILTEALYQQAYGDSMAQKTKNFARIKLIWYLIEPLVATFFTAICLSTAFATINSKIPFEKLLRLSLLAYWVFFVPHLVKFLYFLSLEQDFTPTEYSMFSLGSLVELYDDYRKVGYWVHTLFSTFTLFELLYWLLLAQGLQVYTQWHFGKALRWVLLSYGLGLLLWITLVIFFKMSF